MIEEAIEPLAIEPLYITMHPNDPIFLFGEDDLELRTPTLIFGKGKIQFWWGPIKSVRFELDLIAGTNESQLSTFVGQNAVLNIPTNPPISWEVRINKIAVRPPTVNLGGLVYATRSDEKVLCDELKFHIVNLHAHYGTFIRYPSNESGEYESGASRIALSDNNWDITIDEVKNLTELIKELDREGGFAITHVGVLRQKKKRPFKVTDAMEQMEQLGFFITFIEGRWCFPVFLVGTRNGEIVFRDLSAKGRIDQWGGNWRWSPSEAIDLDLAYRGFVSKWNDRNWREPIAIILEFYARANTYPTVDFSVLDSFTALDRLASAYTLDSIRDGYERIRLTLAKGGLDTLSPQKELYTLYNTLYRTNYPLKTANVATILADFRHGVVHGNRTIKPNDKYCRPKLDEDGDHTNPSVPLEIRIQAKQLGLWCVEMSLLYLIEYNGHYCDRLTKAQDVPIHWSKPFAAKSPR